jgi:hypothetical protein
MKYADEPPLTDQDRRAIEEIRRQLDRDLGPPWPRPKDTASVPGSDHDLAAAIIPIEPRRTGRGLRLALGAGAVTLAAAVIGAFVSFVDLSGQSARSPVSAPRPRDAIFTAPADPPPASVQGMVVPKSDGTGVGVMAESARRGVPIAKHAPTREGAVREPGGGRQRAGRVDASPSGRGGVEAQHRRWNAAPVTYDRSGAPVGTGAPVGLPPARTAPLPLIQAP